MMDFIPGFRGKEGHLVGVSGFTPRLFFGGPLIKNRLNFSEAFTYDVKKSPVRGLAWPNDETKRQGFNTLTSSSSGALTSAPFVCHTERVFEPQAVRRYQCPRARNCLSGRWATRSIHRSERQLAVQLRRATEYDISLHSI